MLDRLAEIAEVVDTLTELPALGSRRAGSCSRGSLQHTHCSPIARLGSAALSSQANPPILVATRANHG